MNTTVLSVSLLSEAGQNFVEMVQKNFNTRYSKGGANGEGFVGTKAVAQLHDLAMDETVKKALIEQAADIDARMRTKISESYLKHTRAGEVNAKHPNPIRKIVFPDPNEISVPQTGEIDPSQQNKYSPLSGTLHKYEMVLVMVAINCSSHCRYCYRLDLFNGSSGKDMAKMDQVFHYVREYNRQIDLLIENGGIWSPERGNYLHPESGEPLLKIHEVLFSGGDPMVLPNLTLARYLALMAEAGVTHIRIGTKEVSFNPERFDSNFFGMVDMFHEVYPTVKLDIVGHYTHPYELVHPIVDEQGEYVYDVQLQYKHREDSFAAITEINRRPFMAHWNQFPIIAGINDDASVLRLLFKVCRVLNIRIHNVYACREIVGNQHFRLDNTIDRQFRLVEAAREGLSGGLAGHARLMMSSEWGKVLISSVVNRKEGTEVHLQLVRHVHGLKPDETCVVVDTSKIPGGKFYWLTREVLETPGAISHGLNVLNIIDEERGSAIKDLKLRIGKWAVEQVEAAASQQDGAQPPVTSGTSEVKVVLHRPDNTSVELEVLPTDKTLSQTLKRYNEIEAACEHKCSCTTCAASVRYEGVGSSAALSESERDQIETLKDIDHSQLRLTCQIKIPASGVLHVTPVFSTK